MPRSETRLIRPTCQPSGWQLLEHVVALIEKSITPAARVRQNVKLPDLTTGRRRQCDVLIEYKQPPRTMCALVEVQKRKARVSISQFQGWWEKMRAIGAQMLICVSEQEFPSSVKDEVIKKHGPTVRLVRLRQIERGEWPIDLQGSLPVYIPVARVDPSRRIEVLYSHDPPVSALPNHIGQTGPLFKTEGVQGALSLKEVLDHIVQRQNAPTFLKEGSFSKTIRFRPEKPLWLQNDEQQRQIAELVIPLVVEVQARDLPIVISAYEQKVDAAGTIAWAADACGTVDGKEVRVTFVFVPQGDGSFEVRRVGSSGIEGGGFLCQG